MVLNHTLFSCCPLLDLWLFHFLENSSFLVSTWASLKCLISLRYPLCNFSIGLRGGSQFRQHIKIWRKTSPELKNWKTVLQRDCYKRTFFYELSHGVSQEQFSGHHSPLEWYFNGVLTLALLILNIPMALWVQNSGHHSPLGWYFNGVLTLALPILHISSWSFIASSIGVGLPLNRDPISTLHGRKNPV